MESDVAALMRGPGPGAARREGGERYADVGRLMITCPDRPGIVAAVSEFLFEATAELDAGPIIEQDIVRVDHRSSADDLRRLGRHVERAVLARAVGWHLEDRVIVHQNSTIVFS